MLDGNVRDFLSHTPAFCLRDVRERDSDPPVPSRPAPPAGPARSHHACPDARTSQSIFAAVNVRGADVPRVDCATVVLATLAALAAQVWRQDGATAAAAAAAAAAEAAPRHEHLHQHQPEPEPDAARAYLFNEHYILKPLRSEYEFRWHRDAAEQLAMCFDQSCVRVA